MYVLLGPPCSGKTTLGDALSKETGLPHIVASSLLKKLNVYQVESEEMDAMQVDVIMSRLRESDCECGFILDNFPRTSAQAKLLEKSLSAQFGKGVSCVFDLEVPVKLLEARAGKRVVDCSTGLPIQGDLTPSTTDDEDGYQQTAMWEEEGTHQAMMRRSDDAPEYFQHRLERYAKNIVSLRSFFAARCTSLAGDWPTQRLLDEAMRTIQKVPTAAAELTVATVCGRQAKVDVSRISTIDELKELIEKFFDIPAGEQKLVVGARVLGCSDRVPAEHVTVVRQKGSDEPPQCANVRESLAEVDEQIQAMEARLSVFFNEVASNAKWTSDSHVQPCGCCTVTKRYVGMDPPHQSLSTQLCFEVKYRVGHCKAKLSEVRRDQIARHREEQEAQNARQLQNMDSFAAFFNQLFFSCTISFPPEDRALMNLQLDCDRMIARADRLRADHTVKSMETANQIDKTFCDEHKPKPCVRRRGGGGGFAADDEEPGSP